MAGGCGVWQIWVDLMAGGWWCVADMGGFNSWRLVVWQIWVDLMAGGWVGGVWQIWVDLMAGGWWCVADMGGFNGWGLVVCGRYEWI